MNRILPFLCFCICVNFGHAQYEGKVVLGDQLALYSEVLEEERSLYVYLPETYSESTFEYPVLYLLDAESDFIHTAGMIHFLSGTGKTPEMILVGVVNTERARDLTPEAPNDEESRAFWGEIGGADAFREFFGKELIPFIESEYRTVPYRLIRGQSFGGLFSLYDYLQPDAMFNAYLTSSPAVRWNEDQLFGDLDALEPGSKKLVKVYLGEPELDWNPENGMKAFGEKLAEKIADPVFFRYGFYEGEGHYSLSFEVSWKALQFVYQHWEVPPSVSRSGDFKLLRDHFAALSAELGYEQKVPMDEIRRFANTQLRNKDYDTGIRIAKESIRLYPKQPQAYWHTGEANFLAGNYQEALALFNQALEKARALGLADLSGYEEAIRRARGKIEKD